MNCIHCQDPINIDHNDNHPGLCCDCFDLSCGMPLQQLNKERAASGKEPVAAWTGRNAAGEKLK
jgi:hypothetical protein